MLLTGIVTLALVFGAFLPLRWGVFGFLASALALFLAQAAISTGSGFEGTSLEESLLLFNGSWVSYLGFNLQITYRAFALPLLGLATVLLFRATRGHP